MSVHDKITRWHFSASCHFGHMSGIFPYLSSVSMDVCSGQLKPRSGRLLLEGYLHLKSVTHQQLPGVLPFVFTPSLPLSLATPLGAAAPTPRSILLCSLGHCARQLPLCGPLMYPFARSHSRIYPPPSLAPASPHASTIRIGWHHTQPYMSMGCLNLMKLAISKNKTPKTKK